jgi:hypothetical protein
MTDEQIKTYEGLSKMVDLAHDKVSEAVFALCAVKRTDGESTLHYARRIEEACGVVQYHRRMLADAQGNKRAFVMSI